MTCVAQRKNPTSKSSELFTSEAVLCMAKQVGLEPSPANSDSLRVRSPMRMNTYPSWMDSPFASKAASFTPSPRDAHPRSLVNCASVPHCEDEHDNLFGFYATDNAMIADTIAPESRPVGK